MASFLIGNRDGGPDPRADDTVSEPTQSKPPIRVEDLSTLIELCGGWANAPRDLAGWVLAPASSWESALERPSASSACYPARRDAERAFLRRTIWPAW